MKDLLIGIIWAVAVFETNAFSWSKCHTTEDILQLDTIEIGPDPLVIPGDVIVTVTGKSSAPIGNSALHLSIHKLTFGGLIKLPIPCISNIGSCTYSNLCTLMDQMKHFTWMKAETASQIEAMLLNSGIDAAECPQPAQTVNIDHQHIHFPSLPKLINHAAAGDYEIKATLTDNVSHKIQMCINSKITVAEKDPCSGFSCIFG